MTLSIRITHGQSDVYKIDPYGTNEDYARLAAEMHKREMKLVMDYVTNHWGIEHWMIKDLPTKNGSINLKPTPKPITSERLFTQCS
jgi:glycosidase